MPGLRKNQLRQPQVFGDLRRLGDGNGRMEGDDGCTFERVALAFRCHNAALSSEILRSSDSSRERHLAQVSI